MYACSVLKLDCMIFPGYFTLKELIYKIKFQNKRSNERC
nr:MAG TPA: hypothetical protein [Caudoviricetes sp.]